MGRSTCHTVLGLSKNILKLSEDPKDLVEPNYLEENARRHFGEEVFLAKERI
ncbi:hypothetical protein YDYSY3_02600 [Paenibacillus chitinolyticus]|nr:hypothetical protein YDYSY3_02600 [Paenibacillus chitinolyticus]